MWGHGKSVEPPAPPPDPEGTIRIGGVLVSVAAEGDTARITLHDKRITHYKLFTVIDAHLQEKGFKLTAVLDQTTGDSTARHFVDKPGTIIFYNTPENSIPLIAETIETACKELAERIRTPEQLTEAFGNIEQYKRNKAIAERFRNSG